MTMELGPRKPMLLVMYVVVICVLTASAKKVPVQNIGPIFMFGDSTLDVGTNNHINNCTAWANHPYYGIDNPETEATRRFSNGVNTADNIGFKDVTSACCADKTPQG
ncbi:hypothetical protein SSX86_031037 [Deinandra increscens subsp. villosa]|uniref:GDSL esterase/lipase n=1 Tax=Deinandra increscens subsp. villosa TaxID=3103831 RepID=A0AAP0GI09_9ASTR